MGSRNGFSLVDIRSGKTFKVYKDDRYKFRRSCLALDRVALEFPDLQLYFLTLTLSDKNLSVCNKNLNRFIDFLRKSFNRSKLPFYYVWVVELQKKRYLKYGKLARHWHFVILAGPASLPDVEFRQNKVPHYKVLKEGSIIKNSELIKRWGYGQVFCKYAWSRDVYGYLGKYLEKQDKKGGGSGFPFTLASRRFGSSNFGYYAYPKWAYSEYLNASQIYPDVFISKKGSRLDILGLDSQGCLIKSVRVASPYKKFSEYDVFSHR